MNRTKIAAFAIGLSLASMAAVAQADDSTTNNAANAIEHPETALHTSEANSASKDVQVDSQMKKEAKARLDQAKKDYEASLKDNGADSSVTKDAKKRLSNARKEYHKYAMKTTKAANDLQEDNQKVSNDKATQ